MGYPQLIWERGTAYDLFISLHVLHHPDKYGLRGAWAAGVRSRLPAAEREMMEAVTDFLLAPAHWVYALPEPKDSATALQTLAATLPEERLPDLVLHPDFNGDAAEIFQAVAARRAWDEADAQALLDINSPKYGNKKDLATMLDWWAQPEKFGERYLAALQSYHEVFFAEEERRIAPLLDQALARAQELSTELELPALLEELSQGVRYLEMHELPELVLVPSFWASPLVIRMKVTADRQLLLFGGRPGNASLVPGEVIPDALFNALKALADPTRLRILRYLAAEPMTPSQLSRRLRLRAPTVIHHLHTLRLAGLVYLTFAAGEKRYAARARAVTTTFDALKAFLEEGEG